MGVRTLSTYVKNHHSTKTYSFSRLKNATIAVDAGVFMYDWMKMAQNESLMARIEGTEEIKPEYRWEWHCIRSLDLLRQYKIKLIFLFDSGHPDEKVDTVKHRKEKKEMAQKSRSSWFEIYRQMNEQMKELKLNQYAIRKAKSQAMSSVLQLIRMIDENSVKATSEHYETFKQILSYAGLRWIECPQEAEYVAVDMLQQNMVDYVMSNDSDCIACQCNNYIMNFNWNSETYQQVHMDQLLKGIRLTPSEFRLACCCMGNDYIENLFRDNMYWTDVRAHMRKLKLKTIESAKEMFGEKADTLQFCWDLYCRKKRFVEKEIRDWMKGSSCVSARKLHVVRETGVCV